MKIAKKLIWLIIILLIVVIGVYFTLRHFSPNQTSYITETVIRTNLQQTVEVTGSVESADEIDLNFATAGTLDRLLVEVGDEVIAGQQLAILSAGSISSKVEDAVAAVEVAQSDLDALIAGASVEDIKVAEEEVSITQSTYQTNLDKLSNLESTRDQELEDLRLAAVNTIEDKYFIGKHSLNVVDDAIMDEIADNYLLVYDADLLARAKSNYNLANSQYNALELGINNLNDHSSQEQVILVLDDLKSVLDLIYDALIDTYSVMIYTIENTEYTKTIIDTLKSSLNTQNTSVATAITSVHDAAYDLRTRDLYYQTSIINAKNDVNYALSNLDLAKAKLNLKKAQPREFEIKAAEAKVRQAQANLGGYLSDLSDTIIKAPVDGIVTSLNFDEGENTSLSLPVVSMIGLSEVQIEVNVPESDITKVKLGDKVEIVLDAFSIEDNFSGIVTFIDPAATIINDVVYYQVTVVLSEKDERIKIGMTADLTIITSSKDDVLVVPTRAIIYQDNKKYLRILEGETMREIEVQTGLSGDNGLVELLSGLKEGEEVVTFVKNGN
ncbi:MAG: hypothetical protein COV55_02105 [Candidatus Komeilibacteria bacterium CG11_big_fil_rev_8_21_14_0_20_36_20]|uniref:CusB-like beta-barrel domain-containing protein n=1 Tax=Candidatus Komeilibacteria bacterium CG11_big_fil_rev_8_21_14_0_20_36_20 TaxID=1974477 RepID=A0A2H0NFM1_9BACT|nr:MAG: hypothetical protein COV55_02105 [Candidatus Komeilibacteria bacterium CG11_big_fil_rev_8_21_14_0_20_36_20]PIR81589.1 MAG: hypothetical protein COU21_02915 [Candidatus Komeilibacteria bacterium CG10_big_fil_rev_8_21_14_0_10_36_65]PJC55427.1 MAG: hypothetical protein CO027_02215 [Candidatus Komeilibacteria bacterium CG_4_9_14_0_2_um_filter_36_13]